MADADGGRQKSGQGGHGVKQILDQDLGDGIPEACCTKHGYRLSRNKVP